MRTSSARIEPIQLEHASDEVREMLESVRWNGVVPNLHRTMATYPSALTAFKAWGKHVLRGGNSLSGSLNYFFQDDSLVADNKNRPNSVFSTYDAALTLGGPIVRDKAWFLSLIHISEPTRPYSIP